MTKRFELVKEDFVHNNNGVTLYRIRSLVDILRHHVKSGDLGGYVEKESNLHGNAWVADNAKIFGNAKISDDAIVFGNAVVFGNAKVYDDAKVFGNAKIFDYSKIFGDAKIYGNTRVYGDIYGNAKVFGNARLFGDSTVFGNADIQNANSIIWFSNVGTEHGTLTVYKTTTGISVTRGCFDGTVEEFLTKSASVHNDDIREEYAALIKVAVNKINRT